MQHPRPTPFDLVFEQAAQTTFPTIRAALSNSDQDPRDRDGFLMLPEVVTLLHELRPDDGLGEGINELAALVHHGFLFWDAGCPTLEIPPDAFPDLLAQPAASQEESPPPPHYTALPEHRIWAQTIPGQAHEPMDGFFQHAAPEPGVLRVLGVFGMHPERPGFSVVEVVGPRSPGLTRPDGSALFAPVLPGGAAAGLFSILGGEELLELGWRTRPVASELEASRWKA